MTGLVIVADDLTGAADSAAPMAARTSTSVVVDASGRWPASEVVALDTDTRYSSPDIAASRVALATGRAHRLGATVYKKIDSTLRGNVGPELRAMVQAWPVRSGRPLVVLAAAFPATGRSTVRGTVHVDGAPLPGPSGGDIAALLRPVGLRTGLLSVERLHEPAAVAGAYDDAGAAGLDVLIVDGESEAHLRTVARAADLARHPVLLAGSGGLARPLAEAWPETRRSPAVPAGTTLVVVGSYATQACEQRERLAEHPDVTHVLLTGDALETAARVQEAATTGHVLLSPDPDEPVRAECAPDVARRLAQVAVAVLDRIGTLVATGGETARAILTEAGAVSFDVLAELEPGIVLSRVPASGVHLVTKAGAFGDPDALLRCLPPAYASVPKER
jgi:uncharacterized protein YgbK (DUF1537 family)